MPTTPRWTRSGVSQPLASGVLMPDLGFYHPIVIHFAIGLITGGVLLRWLPLPHRRAMAGSPALPPLRLPTAATAVAAAAGPDAHSRLEGAPRSVRRMSATPQW